MCLDELKMCSLWLSMICLVLFMQLLLILIVTIFLSLQSFGKCLSARERNLCPILVLIFLLKRGLYQSMLFFCLSFHLLVVSAFWYGAAPPYHKALDECFLIWRGVPYQKALEECRYQYTLHYESPTANIRKNRLRNNILWYNPPLSKNIRTNIRHRFLALVGKHFPKDHKLWRIFNHNTIEISYSGINITKQIMDNHNKHILNSSIQIDNTTDNTNAKDSKTCGCWQKNTCPLNGNFLQSSLIYQATVTRKDNSTTETYIRLTENDFKTRYRNHTASFQHAKHRNSTELSKHIWTLKENNIDHFISWHILSSRSPYNSASKRCNLCLKEKLLIICQPDLPSLNKRKELVSSCRHRNSVAAQQLN